MRVIFIVLLILATMSPALGLPANAFAGGKAEVCVTLVDELTSNALYKGMTPKGSVSLSCAPSNPSLQLNFRTVCWHNVPQNQSCNFDINADCSIQGQYGINDGKFHSVIKLTDGRGKYNIGTLVLTRDCKWIEK